MIDRMDFVQEPHLATSIWRSVREVADELVVHLEGDGPQAALLEANKPGASSAAVQAVFLEEAQRLGFRDESQGLFNSYSSKLLRPDYYLPLGGTGILMEVERGKTTINNMDLLDFWKCHICEHASFLFLMVPRALRQNETMKPRNEFAAVAKRMESFFHPGNYTNVLGLVLIGY